MLFDFLFITTDALCVLLRRIDENAYAFTLHSLVDCVADDTDLIDVIIKLEVILNLLREDILTAFRDDDVLCSSRKVEITI